MLPGCLRVVASRMPGAVRCLSSAAGGGSPAATELRGQESPKQEFRKLNLEEVDFRQPAFVNEEVEVRRKRLSYQSSKRGMLEMDNLFGAFAHKHLQGMDAQQLAELDVILRETDIDLHAWLVKGTPAPDHIHGLATYQLLLAYSLSGELEAVRDHLIGQ
eukprot:EG_transcript_26207